MLPLIQALVRDLHLPSREVVPGSKDSNATKRKNVLLSPTNCQKLIQRLSNVLSSSFATPSSTKLLLIIATANHLSHTINLLTSLEKCNDVFEILFIDDHSTDGTPEYLQKKVMTKRVVHKI